MKTNLGIEKKPRITRMAERVSRGFEKTADWCKGIETTGKNQETMSESALARIMTRFGTRFATRFARWTPESVNCQDILDRIAKATPNSLGNLVANFSREPCRPQYFEYQPLLLQNLLKKQEIEGL